MTLRWIGPGITDRVRPTQVTPDSPQAREWLGQELSKGAYQESLWARLSRWFADLFDLGPDGLGVGAGTIVGLFAAVVMLGFLLLVLGRVRRERTRPVADGGLGGATERSALDHRALAEAALSDGCYDEAIICAFRALAARANERGLIVLTPHHTAREVADSLAAAFSGNRRDIHDAATLFDSVRYGAGLATGAQARRVLSLEGALRQARPRGVRHPAAAGAAP